jgi:hypothetical protein
VPIRKSGFNNVAKIGIVGHGKGNWLMASLNSFFHKRIWNFEEVGVDLPSCRFVSRGRGSGTRIRARFPKTEIFDR